MTKNTHHHHFEEKTAIEHLKEARRKGQRAFESVHGAEPSGSMIAATDAGKEASVFLALLWILLTPLHLPLTKILLILSLFSLAFLIWKTCRSAFLGWSRLERVHRLIKEEKWEIEHHRAQEKEELLELYQAKGFKDKQLEEVVEVLMADDNRLLQIMLEEELGLSLGSFEHPLKQCIGAALGVVISAITCLGALWIGGGIGICIAVFIVLFLSSFFMAKYLGNDKTKSIVWNLSISVLSLAVTYFLFKTILTSFKIL
jgi:vacuolar iron transporter family protein